MFLKQLQNYLLVWALIYLPETGSEFVVRAVRGETVHLPCHLNPNGSDQSTVEWKKNSAQDTIICTYKINSVNKTASGNCEPRFTFDNESLKLNIENVQLSDSGRYRCRRTIIIPPPTFDIIRNVTLLVEDLSLRRLNSSNGSCIDLRCTLEALNPKKVNFTWSKEGQTLPHLSSSSTSSELYLCKPDWDDKDTITCQASYFYNNTLYNMSVHLNLSTDPARGNLRLLIIICSAAAAGVIFSLIFTAVLCKCRRRNANGSIVFTNKVYENFSFAMTRQSTPRTQPTVKPQREECIYEN